MAKDKERPFGRVLFRRLAHQSAACTIARKDGFKIPFENEGAVSFDEEQAARLHDANENFADKCGVFTKILADDRRSARDSRVIAGVGEAGKPLQQNFQFEQLLDLAVQRQSPEP